VVDALHLAKFADAIVCVVSWARTSQQDVRRTVMALSGGKRLETEILMVLAREAGRKTRYGEKPERRPKRIDVRWGAARQVRNVDQELS
jgi:hypothetical protein